MNIIETNLKFNSNHSNRKGDPNGIVLHHAAANGSVEDVHSWHLGNGWAGIGYHFYVRKDGSVYRGRPEKWVGSHTSGHNSKIGICAEGNFETEQMSVSQKNAIIDLLDYLYDKYGKLKVYGHRDLDATACPGKNYPFADIVNGKKENVGEDTPKKETATEPKNDNGGCVVNLPELSNGSRGANVKALQHLLIGYGVSCGRWGADGSFGDATEAAVKQYQKKVFPNQPNEWDGYVGTKTWNKLLGN